MDVRTDREIDEDVRAGCLKDSAAGITPFSFVVLTRGTEYSQGLAALQKGSLNEMMFPF